MAKALQIGLKTKKKADVAADKINKALRTYPFADISPALVIKINARAKRMALRVDTHRRVVNLIIPKRATLRGAYLFALENRHWIRQKVDEMPILINYIDEEVISILGKLITIHINFDPNLKKTDIQLKNNLLVVHTNKNDPALRIRRFIINYAKDQLTKHSLEKAAILGKKVDSVTVKDTISRWGSCSHDGKLNYSWRLIFAPMDAFDYVVAHEVAHLKHLDHSPAFWHVCEDLSANYSKGKTWMKRHSQELIRYS